ncbi:Alpha/Beta hydrolase protein [Cokeromyces recurvatus]|uniref:Alpha/Beta hydrolase protein n=1 Tax=Cokeromyces recurvatus TaxID=90255 RepID=UPI00222073F4|nr:Alpha/Beta hydrolase protein [Cokeromyces recurvatus]KAI7906903.1 Alpha/Beta hydrolase protein [Cokeromyces recurvatus]
MVHPLDDQTVESFSIPGAKVFDRYFDCPLDYSNETTSPKIKVFVRHLIPVDKVSSMKKLPFFLYLQGGPGFECALPGNGTSGWIKVAFEKGYQVLLLDQRGTGFSSQVSSESLDKLFKTDEEKADYLSHFRADSIVRDCETIRKQLTAGRSGTNEEETRITLLGQSFGGFCITTYLSLFPKSIQNAYITGGIPPLVNNPDEVYRALYPRILKKNKLYYKKFSRDMTRVRQIHAYLTSNKVTLPNGGNLSSRRFLQLGLLFGGAGGYDTVHGIVQAAANDLDRLGKLSYRTLNRIQEVQSWDTNVIYAILHEAIYCQSNQSSRWSAERLLSEEPFATDFEWRLQNLKEDQPVYFTGETIYPFMFDDFAELRPLKKVANLLADKSWGQLYDTQVLNKVENIQVAGVSYYDDMYVDLKLSEKTASEINGFEQWITNEYAHNGLRVDGERILAYLMKLARGDEAYNR